MAIADTSVATLTDDQAAASPNFVLNDSGSAQFGDTLSFTSILFTDTNGNPIPGLTIDSSDGYVLPLDVRNAAATPEPTTVALFGIGLAGLLSIRRRS